MIINMPRLQDQSGQFRYQKNYNIFLTTCNKIIISILNNKL